MDRSIEILLHSLESPDGRVSLDMLNMLLGAVSPHVAPFLKRQLGSLVSVVGNRKCADAMTEYVDGVVTKKPELWALRMVDASAKAPQALLAGGSTLLGDYDECLGSRAPAFKGQYCLLTACLTSGQLPCVTNALESSRRMRDALQAQSEAALNASGLLRAAEALPFRVGVCVPSACSAEDVRSLAEYLVEALLSSVPTMPTGLRLRMEPSVCHVDDTRIFRARDFLALFLIIGLCLFVTASTAYDYATRGPKRKRSAVLLAFSAARNALRLSDAAAGDAALPALEGLRALSLGWLVCGSALRVLLQLPLANSQHALKILEKPNAALVTCAFLALDTFLVLNGLIVSYTFLRRSSSGKRLSLLGFYLHRIIRIVPTLGLVLFLQSTIILSIGDGPLWHLQPEQQCLNTSWYIFLQVCNYFRPETVQCMEHLWFLSLDWQLYVMSPLVLLFLRRRPQRVLGALAALGAAGVGLRFWLAYARGLRAPWGSNYSASTMETLYYPTHVRFMPYLLGMVLGYELHRMKYLKTSTHLPQWAVASLQMAWPLLLAGSLAWVHRFSGAGEAPPGRFAEALHLALVHCTWALGVAVFLYLAASDKAGPLSLLLSRGVWRPLSRLSLGVYLLHVPFLNSVMHDTRTAVHLSLWRQVATGALVWVASLPPAAVLWLALKEPAARLQTLLDTPHKGERKRPFENGLAALGTLENDSSYFQISSEDQKIKVDSSSRDYLGATQI